MEITRDTTIEDLVHYSARAVSYLRDKGIKCIACGEPIWGTLAEAAEEKGFDTQTIDTFVKELNALGK